MALAVGALIGGGLAALVLVALRARDRARVEASLELPDGTRAVLQGMDEVAVVVDASLQIVAASSPGTGSSTAGAASSCAKTIPAQSRTAAQTRHFMDIQLVFMAAHRTQAQETRQPGNCPPAALRMDRFVVRIRPRAVLFLVREGVAV